VIKPLQRIDNSINQLHQEALGPMPNVNLPVNSINKLSIESNKSIESIESNKVFEKPIKQHELFEDSSLLQFIRFGRHVEGLPSNEINCVVKAARSYELVHHYDEQNFFYKKVNKGTKVTKYLKIPLQAERIAIVSQANNLGRQLNSTLKRLQKSFFWSGMAKQVKEFIKKCGLCKRKRTVLHGNHQSSFKRIKSAHEAHKKQRDRQRNARVKQLSVSQKVYVNRMSLIMKKPTRLKSINDGGKQAAECQLVKKIIQHHQRSDDKPTEFQVKRQHQPYQPHEPYKRSDFEVEAFCSRGDC
jgi:hypothetical protein